MGFVADLVEFELANVGGVGLKLEEEKGGIIRDGWPKFGGFKEEERGWFRLGGLGFGVELYGIKDKDDMFIGFRLELGELFEFEFGEDIGHMVVVN
ncbi:hypothetical protein U1Q18_021017 [Sarracenia purpurea var. burkii]